MFTSKMYFCDICLSRIGVDTAICELHNYPDSHFCEDCVDKCGVIYCEAVAKNPRILKARKPVDIIDPTNEFTQIPGYSFFGNVGGQIDLMIDADHFTENGCDYDWNDDYDKLAQAYRKEIEFDLWQYVMESV